jgi:2'-5' RNA ligase
MTSARVRAAAVQKVFVALWPTSVVRDRLDAVADQLAPSAPHARRIAAANFHLTLAFIGSLSEERVSELAGSIGQCAAEEFDWVVDHVGHFDRVHVVWAGGAATAALRGLAGRVFALLNSLAIEYDRKAFAPHVTLLRNVTRWHAGRTPIEPAIVWRSRRATLVLSEQTTGGVVYVPLTPP